MADTGNCNLTDTVDSLGRIRRIGFRWLSDTSNNVEARFKVPLDGFLICVVTKPDVGSLAPDDNYDITIEDDLEVDILDGLAADRDTALQERVGLDIELGSHRPVRTEWITFKVSGAGDSNGGLAQLFMV